MDDDITFTPVEVDPEGLLFCGECRAAVTDLEGHRNYHRQLSRGLLRAYRWTLCTNPHCPHPTPHYFTRPQDGEPV